jgi:o-succinylbenzoate---CoA ligase
MININNSDYWLRQQSVLNPNNKAIITDQVKFSFEDFYRIACGAANYFTSCGICEKDNVGIIAGYNFDFYIIINALWFIGAVPVLLNTKNTNEEIICQVNKLEMMFLIIEESIAGKYSFDDCKIKKIILQKDFYKSFNSTLYTHRSKFSSLNTSLMLFTSGSSGQPKAVVHTFNSFFASVKSTDSFSELTKNDIWLASLPMYHIGGFMILIRALLTGSAVVFPPSLKHDEIVKSIFIFRPTHISIVSTTLKKLLDDNITPPECLQKVYLGGGHLDPVLCLEAVSKNWPIIKVYGSSETCSMVTALKTDELLLKPDSAGKPLRKNIVKIANLIADGKQSRNVGEIIIQSGSLFKEYYNAPDLTMNKLVDGFYYTGDFGRIDSEGFLFVESRWEDLIISGGENINASEVESLIKSHETVKDAFVFGIPDKLWGQKVCAAVVADNFDEEKLKTFLKNKIASYKIPKTFFIMGKFPRNEMGKVNRPLLLSQLKLS